MNAATPAAVALDLGELVPQARRIHPAELTAGDLLFDASGRLHPITAASLLHDGKFVSALLDDGHRVWLWDTEPIIAVLPRKTAPTVTFHERVFDPRDSAAPARRSDRDAGVAVWRAPASVPRGRGTRSLAR